MKINTLALNFIFIFFLSCKKESDSTILKFSSSDKQWFIYKPGDKFKFKNLYGDTLEYSVQYADTGIEPVYNDSINNPTMIGKAEYYSVKLVSDFDSIFIYFFKDFKGSNPQALKETIRWHAFKSQFAGIDAIEGKINFITKTIESTTYPKVTSMFPIGTGIYSFTRFDQALYDQKSGLIQIKDITGTVWTKVKTL